MNVRGQELTPGHWVQWLLVSALAASLGFGGSVLRDQVSPPRPDPFTGTEGRQMEQRIMAVIADMDRRHDERVTRIDNEGTRGLQECRARVAALENARAEITAKLQRIEELLVELRVTLGVNRKTPGG